MDEQTKHRKSKRDNLYGKTATHQHLLNKDYANQTYRSNFQQSMQNCQSQTQPQQCQHENQQFQRQHRQCQQQHHQCQQQAHQCQEQHQHSQQQQQCYSHKHQNGDQRKQYHYHSLGYGSCCCDNNRGQQKQSKQNQDPQQQQERKKIESDRELRFPQNPGWDKYIRKLAPDLNQSGTCQTKELLNFSKTSLPSRAHMPLPRDPQMHLPTMEFVNQKEPDDADCGHVLYRNPSYKTESSTGTFDILDSTRAQCEATNARLKEKYANQDDFQSENESTTGESTKTRCSSMTAISWKSGDCLRSVVRLQVKLQDDLNQSISNLNNINENIAVNVRDLQWEHQPPSPFADNRREKLTSRPQNVTQQQPLPSRRSARAPSPMQPSHCEPSCFDGKLPPMSSTELGFSVSVNDMVNARVISPMMRKIQRLYLNNLREEMSIMEDLERVPQLVSEVYQIAAQQELLKRNSSSSK